MKTTIFAVISTLLLFLASAVSQASGNAGITYQGRIIKPDGEPLKGEFVQFKLQLRTPNASSCLMFEEMQTQDLSESNGSFSLTINDGNGVRSDSSGYGLDRIFANNGTFTFLSTACNSGTTYTPSEDDGRTLVVSFKDETMGAFEQMPPQSINFVPMAFEAKQVQGFNAKSLLRVQDSDGTLGNFSPLSNTQYTELLALIGGTSASFGGSNKLNGKTLPTLTAGQVLGYDGTNWTAVTPSLAGGSTSTTLNDPDASTTTGVTFQVSNAITSNYTITWPATAGANGQTLVSDGSGTMTWVTPITSALVKTSPDNAIAIGVGAAVPANNSPSVALGFDALKLGGSWGDVGIGAGALAKSTTGWFNTAVGTFSANALTSANDTTAIGYSALNKTTTGAANTAVGAIAMELNTTGAENVAMGPHALYGNLTSSGNVAIGAGAAWGAPLTGYVSHGNTMIGYRAGMAIDTGSGYNVMLGYQSGRNISTGTNNILIGSMPTAANSNLTTGSNNISIGHNTQLPSATGNNQLNIGNFIYGTGFNGAGATLSAGKVGIGTTAPSATLHLKAGTATAGTSPLKLTQGVLNTSAEDGALEYDPAGLWFTIGSTRYLIPVNTAPGNYSEVTNIGNTTTGINLSPPNGQSVIVTANTTSLSTSAGALVVNGGVGIAENVNAGGNIYSGGNITAVNSMVTPQLYGSTAASGNILIDGTWNATKGNVLLATAGGNVGVGTTTPQNLLHVSNPTAGTAVAGFTNSTTGLTSTDGLTVGTNSTSAWLWNYEASDLLFGTSAVERMRVTAQGNVGIGTTNPDIRGLEVVSELGAGVRGIMSTNYVDAPQAGNLHLRKARGTLAAPTAALAGDSLGAIATHGYDGAIFRQTASIGFQAEENFTSTGTGSRMLFYTSQNGTNGPQERARIDNVGNMVIGSTTATTSRLNVVSNDGDGVPALTIHDNESAATLAALPPITAATTFSWNMSGGEGESSFINRTIATGSTRGFVFAQQTGTGTFTYPMRIEGTTGNVGIGTTAPASKLQVSGAVTNTVSNYSTAFTCGSTTLDFSTSNFQRLNPSNTIGAGTCGVAISNLVAGGSYTLVVTGSAAINAVTYGFSGYSFKYLPVNAPTTAGKDSIYTFLYDGANVYVTWAGGY